MSNRRSLSSRDSRSSSSSRDNRSASLSRDNRSFSYSKEKRSSGSSSKERNISSKENRKVSSANPNRKEKNTVSIYKNDKPKKSSYSLGKVELKPQKQLAISPANNNQSTAKKSKTHITTTSEKPRKLKVLWPLRLEK